MKRQPSLNLRTFALATVAASALLSGCAPLVIGGAVGTGVMVAKDRRTAGAQLEDQGIELKASDRLSMAIGERGRVNVTSYNRRVLITGEVVSEKDKALAVRTIAQVENVREVVDELGVMGSPSLVQRSSDTLITGKVKAAMIDASDLEASAFKVVTERGVVYLMGRVTRREADRATEMTRTVSGVQRVVRVFDIISENELQALQPKPAAPAPATDAKPQPAK